VQLINEALIGQGFACAVSLKFRVPLGRRVRNCCARYGFVSVGFRGEVFESSRPRF
jgi:hypothetical protein